MVKFLGRSRVVISLLNLEGNFNKGCVMIVRVLFTVVMVSVLSACTQEIQNKFGRAVQNWTGTDGVLDVYASDKLVKRFIKVDKLSTAMGTSDSSPRPYRFGYGVLDVNQNQVVDVGEKRVYFEFSDYSTSYVFYENPQ